MKKNFIFSIMYVGFCLHACSQKSSSTGTFSKAVDKPTISNEALYAGLKKTCEETGMVWELDSKGEDGRGSCTMSTLSEKEQCKALGLIWDTERSQCLEELITIKADASACEESGGKWLKNACYTDLAKAPLTEEFCKSPSVGGQWIDKTCYKPLKLDSKKITTSEECESKDVGGQWIDDICYASVNLEPIHKKQCENPKDKDGYGGKWIDGQCYDPLDYDVDEKVVGSDQCQLTKESGGYGGKWINGVCYKIIAQEKNDQLTCTTPAGDGGFGGKWIGNNCYQDITVNRKSDATTCVTDSGNGGYGGKWVILNGSGQCYQALNIQQNSDSTTCTSSADNGGYGGEWIGGRCYVKALAMTQDACKASSERQWISVNNAPAACYSAPNLKTSCTDKFEWNDTDRTCAIKLSTLAERSLTSSDKGVYAYRIKRRVGNDDKCWQKTNTGIQEQICGSSKDQLFLFTDLGGTNTSTTYKITSEGNTVCLTTTALTLSNAPCTTPTEITAQGTPFTYSFKTKINNLDYAVAANNSGQITVSQSPTNFTLEGISKGEADCNIKPNSVWGKDQQGNSVCYATEGKNLVENQQAACVGAGNVWNGTACYKTTELTVNLEIGCTRADPNNIWYNQQCYSRPAVTANTEEACKASVANPNDVVWQNNTCYQTQQIITKTKKSYCEDVTKGTWIDTDANTGTCYETQNAEVAATEDQCNNMTKFQWVSGKCMAKPSTMVERSLTLRPRIDTMPDGEFVAYRIKGAYNGQTYCWENSTDRVKAAGCDTGKASQLFMFTDLQADGITTKYKIKAYGGSSKSLTPSQVNGYYTMTMDSAGQDIAFAATSNGSQYTYELKFENNESLVQVDSDVWRRPGTGTATAAIPFTFEGVTKKQADDMTPEFKLLMTKDRPYAYRLKATIIGSTKYYWSIADRLYATKDSPDGNSSLFIFSQRDYVSEDTKYFIRGYDLDKATCLQEYKFDNTYDMVALANCTSKFVIKYKPNDKISVTTNPSNQVITGADTKYSTPAWLRGTATANSPEITFELEQVRHEEAYKRWYPNNNSIASCSSIKRYTENSATNLPTDYNQSETTQAQNRCKKRRPMFL